MTAKTTSTRELKNGKIRCVVDLSPGEVLVVVKPSLHYRLGGQLDDIVASHVIADIEPVAWCSVSQEWVAA